MFPIIITIIAFVLLVFLIWLAYHQKTLKQRAYLMKEAIRNKDFMFRISTKGLLPGERALQQALNEMGEAMADNIKKNEVAALGHAWGEPFRGDLALCPGLRRRHHALRDQRRNDSRDPRPRQ